MLVLKEVWWGGRSKGLPCCRAGAESWGLQVSVGVWGPCPAGILGKDGHMARDPLCTQMCLAPQTQGTMMLEHPMMQA